MSETVREVMADIIAHIRAANGKRVYIGPRWCSMCRIEPRDLKNQRYCAECRKEYRQNRKLERAGKHQNVRSETVSRG